MADTNTTRYGLVKPEVGASADSWGSKLNTDFDDLDAIGGAITTTGSANAYVLTTSLSLAAYVAGQSFDIKASFGNTGAATINVDTLGAKSLTKNGTTALASGDIVSGNIYRISYDGTQFQIIGGSLSTGYQPLDGDLTAIAALTSAADKMPYSTGSGTWALADLSSAQRTFQTTPSSANLAALVSDETGSGALVFATSPTLVTPILGTPTSGTLTNCTLPVGGVTGLGTGVATWLATPSSANLISAITDETGSGSLVFANTPTLVTPVLGVATATSINKVALTAPATSATLTVADGKTLTVSNTITFTATDGSTLAIGTGGTLGTAAYKATGTSGNTVPLLDGANTFLTGQTVGSGSGAAALNIDGGSASAESIVFKAAATSKWTIGRQILTADSAFDFYSHTLGQGLIKLTETGDAQIYTSATSLATNSIGLRGAPVNVQSVDYTLVLSDAGCSVQQNAAATKAYTIPPNSSVAFPIGTMILLVSGTYSITVTRGAGVQLYDCNGAAGVDADVTITGGGTVLAMATLYKYSTNIWLISKTS